MNRARMELGFAECGSRTRMERSYCEVPFKVTRLHECHEDIPELILMHCTAGIFGGDDLECKIHVRAGARVRITQQSATKVHASQGRPAVVRTRIKVEPGAELHVICNPVIPFASSRLRQFTAVDVEYGAIFSYWESFMAGRVAHGEAWEFHVLGIDTQLRAAGKLLYLDRFLLQPANSDTSAIWMTGGAPYVASGIFWAPGTNRFIEHCRKHIDGAGIDCPAAGFAAVRLLARNGPDLHRGQESFVRGTRLSSR